MMANSASEHIVQPTSLPDVCPAQITDHGSAPGQDQNGLLKEIDGLFAGLNYL
jgi:hypothetical protein